MFKLSIAISALFLSSIPLLAQTPDKEDSEIKAVRHVAELYISGDPTNLIEAFYPSSNLFTTDEKDALRTIPFSEYLDRVKKNAGAAKADRKATINSIDRTGNAATAKITTLTPDSKVTDYLSMLRLNGQWKIVSKTFVVERRTQASTSGGPCSASDHRRFEFMIGAWNTSDPARGTFPSSEGNSTVEPILNGCVIHEHRHITQLGKALFDGDAYWGYDSTTKRWLLFYIDDQSHAQLYEGREDAGHLAFYRERPDPDGKPVLIRIAYEPTNRGYTQTVHRSADQGVTWEPGGVTTYQPKR
jgi:hypothetical protein